jgi:cytochrome P450
MAWALYELGRNPELLAAVQAEVDAFIAAHGGRPITPAQYDERPYTLALMHELGRRHPPIHTTARTALRAGEVPPDPATGIGGFRYPKDALLLCSIAGAQMDPETYADPRTFRIERFLAGITPEMTLTERGRQVQATARRLEEEFRLLPFSAGPGGCVGRGFNTLEIFMVLDALLGRFSFELVDPGREVTESDAAIAGPGPGQLRVRVHRRPAPRA